MANQLTVKHMVDVLKKVPEKKFRIMELAPLLVDEHGKVDIVKAMNMQGELKLAIAEVQTYVHGAKEALKILQYLPGREISADDEDLDLEADAEDDEE